ncbi:MAG: PASTA domain-containing protein [Clostridia bacterium]|nr:PASTA domain-containing protein [Clostridia bacterium]
MQHLLLLKCFGEVLPYLDVKKQEIDEDVKQNIEMPDVTGLSLNDAKKVLKELNLEFEVNGEETEEKIVKEQLPKKGIQIQEGSKITLYTN